jgi:hypothetical protein
VASLHGKVFPLGVQSCAEPTARSRPTSALVLSAKLMVGG